MGHGTCPRVPREKPATESSSSELVAPFPLGTPLSELKVHYGEPDFDDYLDGGRTAAFDKDGYVIDEINETVIGYRFRSPALSVFGAKVGMTFDEINAVLGENKEPVINEAGVQGYILGFTNKNGYKITFYADEENGPTNSVVVMKE